MMSRSPLDEFIEKTIGTKKKPKRKHLSKTDLFCKTSGKVEPGCIFGKISPRYFARDIKTKLETKAENLVHHREKGQDICFVKESFHPYQGISAATIKLKPKPVERFLSPSQAHRNRIERDLEVSLASDLLRKAETRKLRRDQIIKSAYRQGILGYDSPETGHSRYYEHSAKLFSQRKKRLAAKQRRRSIFLASKYRSDILRNSGDVDGLCHRLTHKRKVKPHSKPYTTSSFKKLFGKSSKLQWTRKNRENAPAPRPIEFISNTLKAYSVSQVKSSPSSE